MIAQAVGNKSEVLERSALKPERWGKGDPAVRTVRLPGALAVAVATGLETGAAETTGEACGDEKTP